MFVCVAGKNNISVQVLKYLIINNNGRYRLGVVCNNTESGRDSWQRSLRAFADKNKIKEYRLEDVYHIKNQLFLSLEFDRIIKPCLFEDARLYNIHFSLLPGYRGMYTSAMPILHAEKETGVSLHRIDDGIDTGDIIAQRKIIIQPEDTCRDLYLKLMQEGTELVIENIEDLLSGKEKCYPQGYRGATYYSKRAIDYSNLSIDLRKTAEEIQNQLRAFCFREYQLPEIYGRKIISSKVLKQRSKGRVGEIIDENLNGMILSTVDYNIAVYFDRLDELLEACENGNFGLAADICSVREHINSKNLYGITPLMAATIGNKIEVAKFLIMLGADVFEMDYENNTLITYAMKIKNKSGREAFIKMFVSLGVEKF